MGNSRLFSGARDELYELIEHLLDLAHDSAEQEVRCEVLSELIFTPMRDPSGQSRPSVVDRGRFEILIRRVG